MCGIAGIFYKDRRTAKKPFQNLPKQSILQHRGPDNFGTYTRDNIDLFHWRLSILDRSAAGNQPMTSQCGRFTIVYNGEVYNFKEIRDKISKIRLIKWQSQSDTEVIIEGFATFGPSVFSELNGMFALAIYDSRDQKLHLARDRFGIKPLYIWQDDSAFVFASEPKFIYSHESFKPKISNQGLATYLTYGHATSRVRIYQGVKQLNPAESLYIDHTLSKSSSGLAPLPSWNPKKWTEGQAIKKLRDLLFRVVERQLVADVQVGVLLSGGVDSSILAAITSRILGPRNTESFTLGYEGVGPNYNEVAEAQEYARHFGIRHHVHLIQPNDLISKIEKLLWHFDEPFGDAAALNMVFLAEYVQNFVKVALAGEGADEVFGGYRRYRTEKYVSWFKNLNLITKPIAKFALTRGKIKSNRRLEIFLRSLSQDNQSSRYSAYLQSSLDIHDLLNPEWRQYTDPKAELEKCFEANKKASTIAKLCIVDQQFWLPETYLEKSDKASMASSIEIRVPYLDNEIVEFGNSLPDSFRVRKSVGKWILRKTFEDMVPRFAFNRRKKGFSVPLAQWFRADLYEYFNDNVIRIEAKVWEFLNRKMVVQVFNEHQSKRQDHSGILWLILLLEIWLNRRDLHKQGCASKILH